MDILHILRTVPDAATEKLMAELSKEKRTEAIELYAEETDWANVVDMLFAYDRIICW